MGKLFQELEKSSHWAGLQVALKGGDPRTQSDDTGCGFTFLFEDVARLGMYGKVWISDDTGAMHITVSRAPANHWFRAMGSLGTVGAAGGDPGPVFKGYPAWSWHPAGGGQIAGALGGTLYPVAGVSCSVRVEADVHGPLSAKAGMTVEPQFRERYAAAWAVGVQFLGVLVTNDTTFDVRAVQDLRIREAEQRIRRTG